MSLDQYTVRSTVCAGTSAIRDSVNSEEFRLKIFNETGFDLEIISGEEEARRTLLGVENALGSDPGRYFIVDIGGGSTELILRSEDSPVILMSLPLGVVKLTEQYLRSDPPKPIELKRLRDRINDVIKEECPKLETLVESIVVGTAGTATTLAAMKLGLKRYDANRVQNLRMTFDQVQSHYAVLIGMPMAKRREVVGLELGREDVIIAGMAILLSVLSLTRNKEWVVSDAGLREGLLVNWYIESRGKQENGN